MQSCFPPAAQHSSQSPVSLTSDASSPRPYVSPRNGTPQSNQKSLLGVHPGGITSSQTRVSRRSRKVPIRRMEKYFPLAHDSPTSFSLFFTLLCLPSFLTSSWVSTARPFLFSFLFLSLFAVCSSLFRAAWLQVNKDQSPCLRPQRSAQRTPELSSREGRSHCFVCDGRLLGGKVDKLHTKTLN